MATANGIAGKRVLITAGGAGIGRAIAERFAGEGASVLICDIDEAALKEAGQSAPDIKTCLADVSREDDVDRLFETLNQHLGGIDVLINNAGVAGPTGNLEDLSLEDWRRCMAVSVEGSFLCLRPALRLMKAQKHGCIINMASSAGIMGYPRRTPYAAAKWAIVGLTKSLAMEAGRSGIRVNAIAPGAVEGERIDRVIAAKAEAYGKSPDEIRQNFLSKTSMRTFVRAADIANMALFLASDAGSRLSGQVLAVDGNTETLA